MGTEHIHGNRTAIRAKTHTCKVKTNKFKSLGSLKQMLTTASNAALSGGGGANFLCTQAFETASRHADIPLGKGSHLPILCAAPYFLAKGTSNHTTPHSTWVPSPDDNSPGGSSSRLLDN